MKEEENVIFKGKMTNNILQEIDRLHDECSKMDKASRIGYLLGE